MTTVGILGGGQLARMLALAGHPLGIRCRVLDPSDQPPAAAVAQHVLGQYDDAETVERFSIGVDVVTYEVENACIATLAKSAGTAPVKPAPRALAVASDRLREKTFLRSLGLSTAPYAAVASSDDLNDAVMRLGLPLVLKTRTQGYDGRGQVVVRGKSEIDSAWARLRGRSLVAETLVPFDRELSIIAVRSSEGEFRAYPVVENRHCDGILLSTLAPAPHCTGPLQRAAEQIAIRVMTALDYVGVLAVELFQCGRELLVNEIAPRVHNSGHWTIEGAMTSQFENHLRAILSLPLGSTEPVGASALVNLLGEHPKLDRLLAMPDTHLHLYDKLPRPPRKIGHVTSRAGSVDQATERLAELLRLV